MKNTTFGFIGLGLIGGSIARALKENLKNITIIAYDINADTLKLAKEEQVADITTLKIDESFRACDYLFLCAPVQKNDANLRTISEIISSECLITDVGSVKTDIHRVVREAGLDRQFIGGHPMAGSERVGFVNSRAVLLQNAYYILTPTGTVSCEKLADYQELVKKIEAIPLVLDCEQHDYITAAVSHLPHVIAASLVNLVHDSDNADGLMRMIAAGGFKDITRIASSQASMWQQICLTNTENISRLLDNYINSLQSIRNNLDTRNGEALYKLFDSARTYRDSFINASSGPIKRSFVLTIDIADEPGALAAIATILALQAISIKNIGIVHNREYEGGILRIEFYEESSVKKAKQILDGKGYTIYEPC